MHCAYCGDPIRYLGAEQADAFVRHYYSCPHCGRVWTLSPGGQMEASAAGMPPQAGPSRPAGTKEHPPADGDQPPFPPKG
jgi:hypothetical protein